MMSDFAWLPGWALGCLAVVAVLFTLALLCMPFAVFGTKPRLQELEFQIAEMRAELRALSMRLATRMQSEPGTSPAEMQKGHAPSGQVEAATDTMLGRTVEAKSDDDYLMSAAVLRRDLPSYEDGPGQDDPETLPRRGSVSGERRRPEDLSAAPERVWSRAPWEQPSARSEGRPASPRMDRMQPARTQPREDDDYRPRSEPKLRWPPRD